MEHLKLNDTKQLIHTTEKFDSLDDLNSCLEKVFPIVYQHSNSEVEMVCDRSDLNLTERDRNNASVLNLSRSHLFQADRKAQPYNQLHQSLNRLGLIILNTLGEIELITSQANQYLQIYFATQTNPLKLPEYLQAWIDYQVTYCTSNSNLPKTSLLLQIEQIDKQLVIHLAIESDRNRYLLLFKEHSLSIFPSLELLGLSPRETEVLYWVIRGKDNQAIAKLLNVYISTVRKHLESIFYKLEVKSRTEAIAKTLEKLGISICHPCFDR